MDAPHRARFSVSVTLRRVCLWACVAVTGCGRTPEPAPPPLVAQVTGTMRVAGLSAPVRVVRDRWGVPHIYAQREDDLFFAQGFVQAQDRLFQMDLWRRAAQGRLAEILGANFVARDATTKRIQYDGDLDAEWASYGPDTKAIVGAFVRGINAWVQAARDRPPEEFARAGWRPEIWRPEDLLTRTDAFVASGDGLGDVFRARLVESIGAGRVDLLWPGGSPTVPPQGLDLRLVNYNVADAIRQIGTRPFLAGSNAWTVATGRSSTGGPLLANDPHRALENPSPFYLVHLHAPGWNVTGATPPWLPGVMLGHNERIAWGMTAFDADVQDVYVERLNRDNPHQVDVRGRWVNTRVVVEKLWVKGRPAPVDSARESTPHGVSLALDGERHLAFVLRWSGSEPGGAAGLGALALDRARSWPEFRAALTRWKMPAQEVVYADVDGNIGSQVAALVPVRRGWTGALPVPGWMGRYEWDGWRTLDELPHSFNPASGHVASANRNPARIRRLDEVFSTTRTFDLERFKRMQHDVVATNAGRLVPLLARVRSDRDEVERARLQVLGWDRRMAIDSEPATIYAAWEHRLFRLVAARRLDAALADELVSRAGGAVMAALLAPSRTWFDGEVVGARDRLIAEAFAGAVDDLGRIGGPLDTGRAWGQRHRTTFRHVLGVKSSAAGRFNLGPFATAGYGDTLMATDGPKFEVTTGPSFGALYDVGTWDRSVAQNAPGQSGSPASPHYGDLATLWAAGDYFPLSFSDQAVQANAESTLTLMPREDRPRTR